MTESITKYECNSYKTFDNCGTELELIFDALPDKSIFTKCGADYAGGNETGWLKPHNLLSKSEARRWIAEGGNIGLATGRFFDGIAYVNFDIDNQQAVEGEAKAILESHVVLKFDTKHDNTNYILSVDTEQKLGLLDAYPTTLTHLTDGEQDDLEIFANQFHAVIPPSEVAHKHCSEGKECNNKSGQYNLHSVNKDAEPLSRSAIERLGELWDIEPEPDEESDGGNPKPDEDRNIPSVEPNVNIITEFAENVPHVNTWGEEKKPVELFKRREHYMKHGDWKRQEHFRELYNGHFESVSGSNPQGKAEMRLANYIGFFFGKNEEIVKYFMSNLPYETHYEQYDSHRKQLLEYATSVDWVYCEGVSFRTKLLVAEDILVHGTQAETTVQEIASNIDKSEQSVRNALDILVAEDVVSQESEGRRRIYMNEGVTEKYCEELKEVMVKYEDDEEEQEPKTWV